MAEFGHLGTHEQEKVAKYAKKYLSTVTIIAQAQIGDIVSQGAIVKINCKVIFLYKKQFLINLDTVAIYAVEVKMLVL